MAAGSLSTSLQESVLALLIFGAEPGQIAAGIVTPQHFEEHYSDIAKRAIEYRQRYGVGPGKAHIGDLFDHVLSKQGDSKAQLYQRILVALYRIADSSLNEEYVLNRITTFVLRQTYKSVVTRAADRYQQGGEDEAIADDVGAILAEANNIQITTLSPGTFMGGDNALAFLDDTSVDYLPLGIREFDKVELGPTRKELMVVMAPRGHGKSMFLTHVASCALLHRWKFLDISLEMSEEKKTQRLYQNFFAIAKRNDEWQQAMFELDKKNQLNAILTETRRAKHNLRDPKIEAIIRAKQMPWGTRISERILVKRFPTKQLGIKGLRAYLDYMADSHDFVPDVLCVDMPLLMKLNQDDIRGSLGYLVEELRGEAVERNMAVVMAHHVNRIGEQATKVRGFHAAEDISIMGTADTVLSYSRTEAEKELGLGRLFVPKHRNDRDNFTVLITQAYATATFVLDSAPELDAYQDMLKVLTGATDDK